MIDPACAHHRLTTSSRRGLRSTGDSTRRSIRMLVRAVDCKDPSSRRHSERVARTASIVAELVGWDRAALPRLREAALVHDVGKIAVPSDLLFKKGQLSIEERVEVQAHAARGARIVAGVLSAEQASWVRGHHERWDGGGYPDGLAGNRIPEGARILAVADAWDVMTSERPYSPPRRSAEALAECLVNSGTQFWPPAVAALQRLHRLVPLGSPPPAEPRPSGHRAPVPWAETAAPVS